MNMLTPMGKIENVEKGGAIMLCKDKIVFAIIKKEKFYLTNDLENLELLHPITEKMLQNPDAFLRLVTEGYWIASGNIRDHNLQQKD